MSLCWRARGPYSALRGATLAAMRALLGLFLVLSLASCGASSASSASTHSTPTAPSFVHHADDPAWMDDVRALASRAESNTQTYAHVESLTDAAGPRLAGSPGDALAVAWGVQAMTALGFSNVRAEPVTVRAWVRGDENVSVIAPVPQRLAAAALGGSVGTPEGGLDGEIVRVTSLEALRALAPEAARGRIVFVDQRMERAQDGHGYGDTVPVRGQSASIAGGLGAIAVVIRSIGTDATRFPHTGGMRYADGVPRIPAAAISNADADVLGRWLERGETVRLHVELGCRDAGEAQSANVIGEIPGTDRASEIVLLGAHLDSWDLGRGAIDDGAGVGIVMEAARWIGSAETRPRRTIRVVLFANEENGLAGARAYAAAHASETHVIGLEADFGDGRAWALQTPDASERTDASTPTPRWERIARLLAPMGVVWQADEPHGGADLSPLHEAEDGEPPLANPMPVVDVVQDGTRYFDLHHTPNDVMTEVDRDSLDHAMRAVLMVAYAISLDVP